MLSLLTITTRAEEAAGTPVEGPSEEITEGPVEETMEATSEESSETLAE